ncbi:MAG: uroporphyrinogen-III synthase [Myxococcota bacterium]
MIEFGGGPRVLVTRAAEDAPALVHALALAGFEPVLAPLIERRWAPLALAEVARAHPKADWVLITSATAADVIAAGAPSAWRDARWAAVGPASAGRLLELGIRCTSIPEKATAHDLVVSLGDLTGQTVIYPRADLATPVAADGLRLAGASVVDVVAYENVAPTGFGARLRSQLPVAATTVLSGSAAERLALAVPPEARDGLGKVVVIGPSAARVATERGLAVDVMADPHTVPGVVDAVLRLLRP